MKEVCVLCGTPWHGPSNRCMNKDCNGFCSWGKEKGGPPSSWDVNKNGSWVLKPVPRLVKGNNDIARPNS